VIYLPLHDILTDRWGVPLCNSAMSRNRFCKILHFLSFDVKSNRLQRLHTDKFALFSEVWNHFVNNCYTFTNLKRLSQSTNSFPLAKPDALLPSLRHQSQTSLGKNIGQFFDIGGGVGWATSAETKSNSRPNIINSNENEKQPKKICQVKILCKRNCSVGVCTQCKKSLCKTCTALLQRVCKKCVV